MPKKEVLPKVAPPLSENLKFWIPALSKRAATLTNAAINTETEKIFDQSETF